MNAGLQTAFVSLEGQALYSISEKPNFEEKDIFEIVKVLVEHYS